MKVALQTYSVRQSMNKDVHGTLSRMAQLGYRYFEVANHDQGKPFKGEDTGIGFGIGPNKIKTLMEGLGTEVIGVHLFPFPFDNLGATLAYHKILGTKYIVVPNAFFSSMDDIKALIANLNKAGEKCKKEGFELLYHNHFHEFVKWQGKTILDYLMDETDPSAVGLELDTVWAYMAGADVVDTMRKYGKRVRVIHQKDYNKDMVDSHNLLSKFKDDEPLVMKEMIESFDHRAFVEIGTGVIDIQAIIDAGNEYCQSEYIVLEQDFTTLEELESVRVSMDHFKKYKGIEW